MTRARDDIRIRANVQIIATDIHGKVVYSYKDHNIFLDNGRTWLMQLLGYDTSGGAYARIDWPPGIPGTDPEPNVALAAFVRDIVATPTTAGVRMPWLPFYIGLGVGGNQQSGPVPADVTTDYPGTNVQSDADPTITGLERPVRILLEVAAPPTKARWLNTIATYTPQPLATPYTSIRFSSTFSLSDINTSCRWNGGGAPLDFAVVPVSEAALFRWTDDADMATVQYASPPPPPYTCSQALNYFTFPPIPKTNAIALTVLWDYIVV